MYKKESPESIQQMFASIANNYDKSNDKMSFGLNRWWNKKLIDAASKNNPKKLLDLCAGTGAVAFPFLEKNRQSSAVLLDFCKEMLDFAKIRGKSLENRFETVVADAQKIPLPDGQFDAITMAYGIRNVKDPLQCFKESYRVLKPGGTLFILELTRPKNPLLHLFHSIYLKTLLPIIGKAVAKNGNAYNYLAETIMQFSSPEQLASQLKLALFSEIKIIPIHGGLATLLSCQKII